MAVKKVKLAKNLILSVTAQVISLIVSFVLGFIVPKYIDEYQYSYWQTYVLYVGYVGVLHFGLLDGIVLRYSQYDYDELEKNRIRSQFQILLAFTSILSALTCGISCIFLESTSLWIVILVSVGIITKNIFTYTSYSFQITNRIHKYAFLVIAQRAAYAVVVVILLALKVNDFYWYCIAELFGDICAIFIGAFLNRGLYFGKALPIKEAFKESWINVSAGLFLMIANLSSALIVGAAKMIIQWRWDELVFGKIAFSFSVSNLFLTFVTAISVVLFPSMKRMDQNELPDLYDKIRQIISPVLFVSLLFYFPVCKILNLWLPKYNASLPYLGILLPIIIFSSKVSLLTNNYLKAYRKEKQMLLINLLSIALGIVLFAVFAFAASNLELVLYSVVLVVVVRSVVSEVYAMKLIGKLNKKSILDFAVEIVMTAIFIASARMAGLLYGALIYLGAAVVYLIIYRKSLVAIFKKIAAKFRRGNEN